MADIVVRGLKPETVKWLEERAREHGRSVSAEAAELIDELAGGPEADHSAFLARADELRRQTAGTLQTDSAEIIREDRDSDHGRLTA